eukprot:NODE_27_length_39007_cov_1.590650.p27 type:complete len:143 gc:universal NODE_27_length_39007_cov_1.590650:2007-1579(-)
MSFSGMPSTPASPLSTPWHEIFVKCKIPKNAFQDEISKHDNLQGKFDLLFTSPSIYRDSIQLDFIKPTRDLQPSILSTSDDRSNMALPVSTSPVEHVTYSDFQKVIMEPQVVELPKNEVKDQDIENVLDDLLRPTFEKMAAK